MDVAGLEERWGPLKQSSRGVWVITRLLPTACTRPPTRCLSNSNQEKWNFKFKDAPGIPVVAGEAVYSVFFAGAEKGANFLYAIDGDTGQQKWKFETKGPCRTPIIADGVVYIGCFGNFHAVDAQSGTAKWGFEDTANLEGKKVKPVASSPAISNGTLYFITDEGFVYAIR